MRTGPIRTWPQCGPTEAKPADKRSHIWSERNVICDQLSRVPPGGCPEIKELAGAVHAARKLVPGFLLENLIKEAKTTVE